MSLENDIAEIKAKLEANVNIDELQAANIQLKNDIAALSQNESGAKAELEKTISDLKDSLTQKDNEIQTKDQTIAQKIQELDAANEVIAAYKSKEEEMMKKEKKMKRVAQLLEKGVDNETAMSTTDKFESIDDEAFEAVVLLAGKMPPWLEKIKKGDDKEDDKKTKEKKKASEEIADPEVLDNVEVTEEVNLGIGGEVESEVDSTRAALVEFVRSRLSKSTK